MRFRKWLFTILALLALGWIVFGMSSVNEVRTKQLQSTEVQNSSAAQLGTEIGSGINTTIVLCPGVPLFFLFALLAWRNAVGLTNKKRHEEMLAALQQNQKPQA